MQAARELQPQVVPDQVGGDLEPLRGELALDGDAVEPHGVGIHLVEQTLTPASGATRQPASGNFLRAAAASVACATSPPTNRMSSGTSSDVNRRAARPQTRQMFSGKESSAWPGSAAGVASGCRRFTGTPRAARAAPA